MSLAALIYLHKTAGRDRKIADALSKLVEEARGEQDTDEGTEGHDEPEGHAEGTPRSRDQEWRKPRSTEWPLTWAFVCGAGDENRTRTVSLGS